MDTRFRTIGVIEPDGKLPQLVRLAITAGGSTLLWTILIEGVRML